MQPIHHPFAAATRFTGGVVTLFLLILAAWASGPETARAGFGFSEPKVLNLNYQTNTADNFAPDIATDGDGTWICVWHSANKIDGNTGDTDIFFAKSTDNGKTWSYPRLLNKNGVTDRTLDAAARIACGPTGTWVCVWAGFGFDGSGIDIAFSRSEDAGITWSTPASLDRIAAQGATSNVFPIVRSGQSGQWVVTWQQTSSSGASNSDHWNPMVSHSSNDGEAWTPGIALNSTASFNPSPGYVLTDQATDLAGNWVAIWAAPDTMASVPALDHDIFYSRSTDGGLSWLNMQPLDPAFLDDHGDDGYTGLDGASDNPVIQTDRLGNWVIVWASTDTRGGTIGTDADLLFARSTNVGQTWSDPMPLNSNAATDVDGIAGNDINPALAVDSQGRWICVWASTAFSAPHYYDRDMAVSRSIDGGKSWAQISPLSLNSVADFSGYDSQTRLATDRLGGWVCVWGTEQLGLGGPTFRNVAVSTSENIDLPASPAFCNNAEATLIQNIILGHLVLDLNGDGKIDVSDLNANGLCAPE